MRALTNSICPVCRKEICGFKNVYLYALEKPYANILIHFECYTENKQKIPQILQETVDLWYNINYNEKISYKKKGKLK